MGYKKGSFPPAGDCLIIPISDTISIEKLLIPHPRYKNITGRGIFNCTALHNTDAPVFVTEGVFDALSVIEVGGAAVSINGTSMVDKFIEYINSNKLTPKLIVALDADSAGKTAANKICDYLSTMDIP